MVVKVIDASSVAAMLFGEPNADAVAARLEGTRLAAPALISYEIANVCLTKSKLHPEQRDLLRESLLLYDRLAIEEVEIDRVEVFDLARETGLSAYDASYLWLARRLSAELVTLDKRLARFEIQ